VPPANVDNYLENIKKVYKEKIPNWQDKK